MTGGINLIRFENAISVRNEGILPCNRSTNQLKKFQMLKIIEMEILPGRKSAF